jgi:hypothetical protein
MERKLHHYVLKMDAASSPEALVTIYQTTWHHG